MEKVVSALCTSTSPVLNICKVSIQSIVQFCEELWSQDCVIFYGHIERIKALCEKGQRFQIDPISRKDVTKIQVFTCITGIIVLLQKYGGNRFHIWLHNFYLAYSTNFFPIKFVCWSEFISWYWPDESKQILIIISMKKTWYTILILVPYIDLWGNVYFI